NIPTQSLDGGGSVTWTESSPGTYTGTITAGTKAGQVNIMPLPNRANGATAPAVLTVTPGPVDMAQSVLSDISPNPVMVSGNQITTASLVFTAKDSNGNPVPGLTIQDVDGSTFLTDTTISWEETSASIYTGTVTVGHHSGSLVVQPKIAQQSGVILPTRSLTVIPGPASVNTSTLNIDKTEITVGGSAILTYTAKDDYGNPITGLSLSQYFSGAAAAGSSVTWVEQAGGVYLGTLTAGTTAGPLSVQLLSGGAYVSGSQSLTVIAGAVDPVKSLVTATSSGINAGGGTTILTYKPVDSNGNAITGLSASLSTISSDSSSQVGAWIEGPAGTYTATLTGGDVAGTMNVTPQITSGGNTSSGVQSPAVVTTYPVAITLSTDKQDVSVESGQILATVTATGQNGDPISGVVVAYKTVAVTDRQGRQRSDSGQLQINGGNIGSVTGTTSVNGTAVVTVTDPQGIGVQSQIAATTTSVTGAILMSSSQPKLIFRIITSPDNNKANMWGHMVDTITAGGITFRRTPLYGETAGTYAYNESNETWSTFDYAGAIAYCPGLPTSAQLQAIYAQEGNAKIALGWPNNYFYRSSTQTPTSGFTYAVGLGNGIISSSPDTNSGGPVACPQ
ncbi:invasin domain 3-containing protein, partial [Serratia bockelmannii]|uniref:invasin domain 3-containing protein n=1 Tax=Serratia bockelmannii TaxID=2703793 RepID=UPI00235F8ACC